MTILFWKLLVGASLGLFVLGVFILMNADTDCPTRVDFGQFVPVPQVEPIK